MPYAHPLHTDDDLRPPRTNDHKTIPTLIIGSDRLAMEGLRSILQYSRFRVMGCRLKITPSCPPVTDTRTTWILILGNSIDHESAVEQARLLRTWRHDHVIVALKDSTIADRRILDTFHGSIERSHSGFEVIRELERCQISPEKRNFKRNSQPPATIHIIAQEIDFVRPGDDHSC